MDCLPPPEPLVLTNTPADNWKKFRQRIELYFKATETNKKRTPAQKAAIFLHVAGPEAIEVFNTLPLSAEQREDYDSIVKAFEDYCTPRCNETFERYVLRSRQQQDGEPFEQFLRDIQLKAQTCNFGELRDSMVRDQIVCGIVDKKLRARLLQEKDLTLESAVEICKAAELAATQNRALESEAKVQRVEKIANAAGQSRTSGQPRRCGYCGKIHGPRRCPAFGKTCTLCNKRNHFAACCRSRRGVHELGVAATEDALEESSDATDEDIQVLTVQIRNVSKNQDWTVAGDLAGHPTELKVDTGAQANILPYSYFRRMRLPTMVRPSTTVLTNYEGSKIHHLGVISLPLRLGEQQENISFFVVKRGKQVLLGLNAAERFGLISRVHDVSSRSDVSTDWVTEFPELFHGLGCIRRPYSLAMKDDARPTIMPPRKVPHALRAPLKQELARMVSQGIICKMEEPSDWVSPLVLIMKKNGRMRICLDPRYINRSLKREHYQLPSREEIEAELAGAVMFTKLDANSGFHQIPLDEDTSKICTFSTPFGRYRFLRLPFGIASAPEVFQKAMTEVFENLPGTRVYVDDILIWGASKEQHDQRLRAALMAARKAGLTLNKEKCLFAKAEVKFLGDCISKEGIKPDASLIECVANMQKPSSKQEVQRFLGIMNYFGKFIPNLSKRTDALRSLIKNDVEFIWEVHHDKEWKDLIKALTSAPVIAVFDPLKQTKLSADASSFAVGAALLQLHDQDWRPVGYASRVLSKAETKYAQIEKEALAVTFACERFREFVLGLSVTVETDHRPLLAISQKNLSEMPPRLQRYFLRLMPFDIKLQYVPGKHLLVADTLSRIPGTQPSDGESEQDVCIHATRVLASIVSENTKTELTSAILADPYLKQVVEALQEGRPVSGELAPCLSELSYVDGVLLRGSRVVIPKSLRRSMLQRLHEGHLGMSKCKARARLLMYWPGMNADIKSLISKCATCQHFAYRQPSEPLLSREIPTRPWQRIGVDLFDHGGKRYLVAYCAYSNYPEVEQLPQSTSQVVVDTLGTMFARHGIPIEVCTDGGPQFTSREFRQFAVKYDFTHTISSPHFPRANGLAEKGVQVVKRLLKKSEYAGEEFWVALLNYRISPLIDGRTPSQLLMGRMLRGRLPDFSSASTSSVRKHPQDHCKGIPLTPLSEGDVVRIRNDKGWFPKARVEKLAGPRSYIVCTDEGRRYRRNRQHLKRTPEHLDPLDDKDVAPIIPSPIQHRQHSTSDTAPDLTTASASRKERHPSQQAPASDALLNQSAARAPPIASQPSRDPDVVPSQHKVTCQAQEAADSSLRRSTRPRRAPTRFADYIT